MFPIDQSFAYVAYIQVAIIGLVIGVVSGVLTVLILKVRLRGSAIALDAFLGAAGSMIAVAASWQVGFQYPFILAIIFAVVLPAVQQFLHFRRSAVRTKPGKVGDGKVGDRRNVC